MSGKHGAGAPLGAGLATFVNRQSRSTPAQLTARVRVFNAQAKPAIKPKPSKR